MAQQTLDSALGEVRALLLDGDRLVRAVAAGRRKGENPSVVRADLRPVVIKAGPRLQVVTSDGVRPYTRNLPWPDASAAVDALLHEPFGNWHVETATETLQLRVTKKGDALVHREARAQPDPPSLEHDRSKVRLVDPDDPLYQVIGGSGPKRRQVEAFLRMLAATLDLDRREPLHLVDLGCGNAYLTFAAYRFLTQHGTDVELIGVDVREDQRQRNTRLARELGWAGRVRFVSGTIADAPVRFTDSDSEPERVDVVLALHACDTATDEALARAVTWQARSVLAAPCCHHDIARQLQLLAAPPPYDLVTAYPILRERLADVLTDTLRAALLRQHGYRVDVMEFVEARHTPRNLLIRARWSGLPATAELRQEYDRLVSQWQVIPYLGTLLGDQAAPGAVR
jgi:SAM-dependent methyltransferase